MQWCTKQSPFSLNSQCIWEDKGQMDIHSVSSYFKSYLKKKWNRVKRLKNQGGTILNRMIREGTSDKVIFEQIPKGNKEMSTFGDRAFQAKWTTRLRSQDHAYMFQKHSGYQCGLSTMKEEQVVKDQVRELVGPSHVTHGKVYPFFTLSQRRIHWRILSRFEAWSNCS